MKKTIYTLIAYLPDVAGWHDRSGDYHYGKESEIKIQYFTDIQNAGESMGEMKFINEDFEFTLLVNGLNEDEQHEFLSVVEQQEMEEVCQQIRDISYTKVKLLKEIKHQQEEAEKLRKEQEAELMKKRELARIEQREREQLAQLQEKYLNT